MSFEELMDTGGPNEKLQLEDLQRRLQSDDPINIQFTSVSHRLFTIFEEATHLTDCWSVFHFYVEARQPWKQFFFT